MTERRDPGDAPGSLPALRLVGVALLALGAIALYGTFQITRAGGYSVVGPAAVPMVVAIGLIVLSVVFIIRTTVRPDIDLFERVRTEEAAAYWPTVLMLIVLLIVYALALGPLGYIPTTAAFLPVGARLMGSRRPVRDSLVGVAMAIVIFVAFTYVLGLRLPAGLLEPLL